MRYVSIWMPYINSSSTLSVNEMTDPSLCIYLPVYLNKGHNLPRQRFYIFLSDQRCLSRRSYIRWRGVLFVDFGWKRNCTGGWLWGPNHQNDNYREYTYQGTDSKAVERADEKAHSNQGSYSKANKKTHGKADRKAYTETFRSAYETRSMHQSTQLGIQQCCRSDLRCHFRRRYWENHSKPKVQRERPCTTKKNQALLSIVLQEKMQSKRKPESKRDQGLDFGWKNGKGANDEEEHQSQQESQHESEKESETNEQETRQNWVYFKNVMIKTLVTIPFPFAPICNSSQLDSSFAER